MRRTKSTILVSVCMLLFAAVLAANPALATKAANPGQKGPYEIGHTSFMLFDPSRDGTRPGFPEFEQRPIPVSVWYPVDPQSIGPQAPDAIYQLDPLYNPSNPDLTTLSSDWEPYGIDRAYQEPASSARKPFPLVVFSPGWGGPIWIHISVATRLASHGFVVAVMYHFGDQWWWWEPPFDAIAVASYNRPRDVAFVLTNLLERNNTQGNLLFKLIRPDQVVASGWSLGGYAAMTLAGGDDSVCDTLLDWPPEYGEVPAWTCVPTERDPRIKAILPLDGSNQLLHFYELARIKVPSIGIGEEWNMVLDWQARQHAAFKGKPAYRVDLYNTIHQSFCDLCEAGQLFVDKNIFPDLGQILLDYLCVNVMPSPLAHQLTSTYMIAFLKTHIVREQGYQEMLTPGYALTRTPDAEFFVTEKRDPHSIDQDWPDLYVYFPHQPGSEQARAEKDSKQFRPIPRAGGLK